MHNPLPGRGIDTRVTFFFEKKKIQLINSQTVWKKDKIFKKLYQCRDGWPSSPPLLTQISKITCPDNARDVNNYLALSTKGGA